MVSKDDWRRMGQEKYYMAKKLKYVPKYTPYSESWDHEHCEFCFGKISAYEGDMHEGYCIIDSKDWICVDCFRDFEEEFQWEVL